MQIHRRRWVREGGFGTLRAGWIVVFSVKCCFVLDVVVVVVVVLRRAIGFLDVVQRATQT
jgi:hypothetical protein